MIIDFHQGVFRGIQKKDMTYSENMKRDLVELIWNQSFI